MFTVSPESAGLYYLYVHMLVDDRESASFYLKRNDEELCRSQGSSTNRGRHNTGTCAATAELNAGKE